MALAHLRYNQRDFEPARKLAESVLTLAEQAKAPPMLAGAHFQLGVGLFSTGQLEEAREHFERAVELFGPGPSRNLDAYFRQNAPQLLVAVLIVLGHPSTALSRFRDLDSLAAARRRSDPYAIATALFNEGMHHLVLRDSRMMAERADEMLSIATEHEMAIYTFQATFLRGWAMAVAGRGEQGIAEMRRSISDPKVAERLSISLLLVALAETCGKNRRPEEGLELVTKGLATAEQTGLRIADAELHRLKGELTLLKDPGSETEAEVCFRTAIGIARRQAARLFELRATISLARLLAKQGHRDEARAMLAEIYNWFTEGFEFADLKDAKALLDDHSA